MATLSISASGHRASHGPMSGRLAAGLAGVGLFGLVLAVQHLARVPGAFPIGDFFAIWSYAQVAADQGPALLYDMQGLHAALLALGQDTPEPNPYPYPPHAILLFMVLAPLGYWAAALLWLGGGFALFAWALAARQTRPWTVAGVAALLPATAVTLVYGQSGCLIAALLIGGARLLPARPVAAGLLFALLTVKPQFGLLVPIALVAAGQWRCVGAAAAGTAVLATAATAWQGWHVWSAWWEALPAYQAFFESRAPGPMTTVLAALRLVGAPAPLPWLGQAAAGVLAAAVTWRAWRQPGRKLAPDAVPVLLAATVLATPHALVYDLPLLAGAVVLHVLARPDPGSARALVLLAALALPAAGLLSPVPLPIAPFVLLPCLAVMAGTFTRTHQPHHQEPPA